MTPSRPLFWNALAAFLILPGTVAFLVPWLLRPPGAAIRFSGLACSCSSGASETSMSLGVVASPHGLPRSTWSSSGYIAFHGTRCTSPSSSSC